MELSKIQIDENYNVTIPGDYVKFMFLPNEAIVLRTRMDKLYHDIWDAVIKRNKEDEIEKEVERRVYIIQEQLRRKAECNWKPEKK